MKKLLTYVLWSSTKHAKQPEQRYWLNLPYLLVANSCLFHDFNMRFYVHRDSIRHPFFVFLEGTAKMFSKVEFEVLNIPYKGTQLTTHRMKPLWERNVNYFFCKDMDYAVCSLERKCMDYFMEQNRCCIHSIRARRSHSCMPLYAGLCGFHVNKTFNVIKLLAPTFDGYIKYAYNKVPFYKNGIWHCDQDLLRAFFCAPGLSGIILDCPQTDAALRVKSEDNFPQDNTYNPVLCTSGEYSNRKLIGYNVAATKFIDKLFLSPSPWNRFKPFVGRGWTCNSAYLKKLIHVVNNEMAEAVKKIFMDKFGGINYKIECSGQWGST